MPKLSYGPAAKARTQHLLIVLIDYGNDELWAADDATPAEEQQFERSLDALRPHLSSHWQSDRALIIRTKIRHLAQLSQLVNPNQALSANQTKEALSHLNKFLDILEDNRTSRRGSDTWHFTLHLGADRRDRSGIEQWFSETWAKQHPKAKPAPATEPPSKPPFKQAAIAHASDAKATHPASNSGNAWQDLCRQDLSRRRHQELTTNPLTVQVGLSFSTEDLYVPIVLERVVIKPAAGDRASEQPAEDSAAENSIGTRELFEHLLARSQPRVAIVGEPGVGKTTLLQQAAAWILDQTQDLPLWISLADLDKPSELENHVFETWLKTALRQRTAPAERQAELEQQFVQGRVWLLLDAVDEMSLPASLALTQLAKQLDGCLGEARVLLTSRSNVWQSGNNALVDFETYRLRGYAQSQGQGQESAGLRDSPLVRSPSDLAQTPIATVIHRWFQSNPDAAKQLLAELFRPDRRRIRDALRNPLRLALLCRCWSLGQGKLPETKALLYGQFVEAIYDWKQDCFPTAIAQRQQLNRILGQIALMAMRQPRPLFRLPESLLFQALEAAGVSDFSWIDLALQLGWLTRSSGSAEPSYRFYHVTFQEYFAARQLSCWRDLVECGSDEIDAEPQATPAIFSTAWREVILLWLGRPDVAMVEKAALMSYLMEFEDNCGGFYAAQAMLLAGQGLAEFAEFERRDAVAEQLLEWRFNRYGRTPRALTQETQRMLSQSDQSTVIAAFERLLQDPQLFSFKRWMAAYSLGKSYDPGNALAIATLTSLLTKSAEWPLADRIELAKHLGTIDSGNAAAIAFLEALLSEAIANAAKPQLRRKIALRLGLVDSENPQAIAQLTQLLDNCPKPHFQQQLLEDLQKIAPGHPRLQQLSSTQAIPKQASKSARRQRPGDPQRAIASILNRLSNATTLEAKLRLAYRLGRYELGHPTAKQLLLQGLHEAQQRSQLRRIPAMLIEILSEAQLTEVVAEIQPFYLHLCAELRAAQSASPVSWERAQACYSLLWHCAQVLPYSDFCRACLEK